MLKVRSKAPSFTLTRLDRGESMLKELLEQGPALVVFFKVSCPTCQLALPFVERIGKGSMPVVLISQDDASSTRRFHDKFGITLTTLLDQASHRYPASNAFAIEHVPSMFLIETDGTISFSSEGFLKTDLEKLGERAGVAPFRADEAVPSWKAG